MPPKRRAASGSTGRATRQKAEVKEVEKPQTTRSGRGRSTNKAPETPTKAAKGRKESKSPAPARGRAKKAESPVSTRPTRGRSAAKSAGDEVETSKPLGRSSKRGQEQDVGAVEETTAATTPKGRRGRTPTTPKATKSTPKATKSTPKATKSTPKATKSTPKAKKNTPKAAEKVTPKTTPRRGRRGKVEEEVPTESEPLDDTEAAKPVEDEAKEEPMEQEEPVVVASPAKGRRSRGRKSDVQEPEKSEPAKEVTSPRARGRGKKAATPQATSPSPRSKRGRGAKAQPTETPADTVESTEKEILTPKEDKEEDTPTELKTTVDDEAPVEEVATDNLKRKRDDEEENAPKEEEASSKRIREEDTAEEKSKEEVPMETTAPELDTPTEELPVEAPVIEIVTPVLGKGDTPKSDVIQKIDTPEPAIVQESDTPEPDVVEKSDTPEPEVVEKIDTPEPEVVEKSDTPEPVIIEQSDTPEPVIIEKSDTPEVEPEVIAEVSPIEAEPEVPLMEVIDSPTPEKETHDSNDVVEVQEVPGDEIKEVSVSPVEVIDDPVTEKETDDVIEEVGEKKIDNVDDAVECIEDEEDVVEDNASGKETPEIVSVVSVNVPPVIEDVSEASSDVPVIEHEVPAPVGEVIGEDIPDSTEKKDDEVDELKEYVVVDLKDVPDAQSAEITEALPQQVAQPSENQIEPAETQPEPVVMETTQEPTSQHSDTNVNGVNHTNNINDPLLSRKFIPNPHLTSDIDTSQRFTVVSYNILADYHIRSNPEGHSYLPEEYLCQEYRHARMMVELQYLDADVICLQEVGKTYFSQLEEELRRHGYLGVFKCRTADTHPEGEATFYRNSRFTLIECTTSVIRELAYKDLETSGLPMHEQVAVRKFLNHPDVLVVTKLRCNTTGKVVTVGNVHVGYTQFKLRNLQCIQISQSIKKVVEVAGGADNPHIICGDFNSQPDTPGYQLACDGYLNDTTMNALQALRHVEMPDGSQAALINLWWKGFMHTSPNLKSAYALAQGSEPEVTSITSQARTLDYIFLSPTALNLVGVTQVPSPAVLVVSLTQNTIYQGDIN
ncbi:unnamed protein product [Owenia fusiformis]|uniref:Endonuclease/exonuclease/phosphatase domain-containing protein n=1 Tax=Owenia fusiformis TaxID=6347 RepID=A0A8J1TE51_OWEFU|nr:unnamed protein product [Owenia fusiformis]